MARPITHRGARASHSPKGASISVPFACPLAPPAVHRVCSLGDSPILSAKLHKVGNRASMWERLVSAMGRKRTLARSHLPRKTAGCRHPFVDQLRVVAG